MYVENVILNLRIIYTQLLYLDLLRTCPCSKRELGGKKKKYICGVRLHPFDHVWIPWSRI